MKSSISAKIDTELYEEVQAAIKAEKYTSNTECIIEGLNLLLRKPDQEDSEVELLLQEKEKEIKNMQEEVNRSKAEIQVLQEEVKRSKEEVNRSKEDYTRQIKGLRSEIERLSISLQEAPDPVELVKLQTENEGLKMVLEERNKRIEEISNHYENISSFANHFKSVEPKLLEAPAEQRAKKPFLTRLKEVFIPG